MMTKTEKLQRKIIDLQAAYDAALLEIKVVKAERDFLNRNLDELSSKLEIVSFVEVEI